MRATPPRVLVTGGVRSGKSRRANVWAEWLGRPVTVVATAEPVDEELRQRIESHRRNRPRDWRTIEAPRRLAAAVERLGEGDHCVLIDCLTLWLTNLLVDGDQRALEGEVEALLAVLRRRERCIVMVANECGLGLIGATSLSRRFADLAGEVQQRVAECCNRVELMVAGLPLVLKGATLHAPG